MNSHTLMITMANRPDTLARISALLAARNVRIESIIGAPAKNPDHYRIRLVVSAVRGRIEQIAKQILKLVDTIKVVDVTREAGSAPHKFLLVKVDSGKGGEPPLRVLQDFEATLDLARPDMCIDLTDPGAKVEKYIDFLKPRRARKSPLPGKPL